MALTGPRIVASIYKVTGPNALGGSSQFGTTLELAFGPGVSFYDIVPTVINGATCNAIINVQPSGLEQHATKYWTVQTVATIISGGS